MSGIGLSMAFLSTLYSIYSYSTSERIKAYLMLPFKKSNVFFSFLFAQYFSLILERMSFVIIFALFFTKSPILIILYMILGSLTAVILDTAILMSRNTKKMPITIGSIISIAALYMLLIYSQNHILNLVALVISAFIGIGFVLYFEPKHLIISREGKSRNTSSKLSHSSRESHSSRLNYFVSVVIREKTIFIHTIVLFVFAGMFILTSKGEIFLMNAVWCIFAVNTQITTMFSGDKALLRHEKMLPRQSRLMSGIYGKFLAIYFTIANTYILIMFAAVGNFSMNLIFVGIILTSLETGGVLLLERKYPIRNWQKKQEVWRNPRKYILPIIVFTIVSMPVLFQIWI